MLLSQMSEIKAGWGISVSRVALTCCFPPSCQEIETHSSGSWRASVSLGRRSCSLTVFGALRQQEKQHHMLLVLGVILMPQFFQLSSSPFRQSFWLRICFSHPRSTSVCLSPGSPWEQNAPCTWKTSLWMPMLVHWSLAAVSDLCTNAQAYISSHEYFWAQHTDTCAYGALKRRRYLIQLEAQPRVGPW